MNNQAANESQKEQLSVIGDIFANMMTDAETIIERQRRIMQQQMDDVTLQMGNMIKDAMLSICASTGLTVDIVRAAVASKKAALDANGHTDDTEGGGQD